MKATKWTLEERKNLSKLLKQGYKINTLLKTFRSMDYKGKQSEIIFRKELKKGLTANDYNMGLYPKYEVDRAMYAELKNVFDDDGLKYLKDNFKRIMSYENE